MRESDDERPDILGRKISANIPPQIPQSLRIPWWVGLFTAVPLSLLFWELVFARACSR
jgi:hypothetical protein